MFFTVTAAALVGAIALYQAFKIGENYGQEKKDIKHGMLIDVSYINKKEG